MMFFQRLSPAYIHPARSQSNGLLIIRERILQTMLIILCASGLPTVIMASAGSIADGKNGLTFLYTSVYLLFIALMINRGLPYSLRASAMASVAYLLALSELFDSGQLGEVRMFLIAFVAMTAVFFRYRIVIGSILLSLLTIIGAGLLSTTLSNTILPSLANLNQGTGWVISSVTFLMLSTMVAGAISMIISGLETNLESQSQLAQNFERERNMLEQRVSERTQDITRRMNQLRTAVEISRAVNELTNQEVLLQKICDILKDRFGLYYVGVFLLDDERQFAVLKAGTGEAGQKMAASGHHLAVGGSSMIGWAIANHRARIALDAGTEAVRFNNPHLPFTRSELALPIIAHDEIQGAVTIQSEKPGAFDEDDISILQSVADSLAIALENARLYQETHESLVEIRALNRDYIQHAWAETMQVYGDLSYEYDPKQAPSDHPGITIQIPLTLRDEVIGDFFLEIDRPELTDEEGSFIENIATQTAMALENARLLQETERRAVQEQKLNEIGARFSRATSIEDILRAAAQELGQLPSVSEASVHLSPTGVEIGRKTPPSQNKPDANNGKEQS